MRSFFLDGGRKMAKNSGGFKTVGDLIGVSRDISR